MKIVAEKILEAVRRFGKSRDDQRAIALPSENVPFALAGVERELDEFRAFTIATEHAKIEQAAALAISLALVAILRTLYSRDSSCTIEWSADYQRY